MSEKDNKRTATKPNNDNKASNEKAKQEGAKDQQGHQREPGYDEA